MAVRYAMAREVGCTMQLHEREVRRLCGLGLIGAKLTPGGGWRIPVHADGWPEVVTVARRAEPKRPRRAGRAGAVRGPKWARRSAGTAGARCG
jgi:hypothetical protein